MGWGGQEIRILTECRGMIRRGHEVLVAARPGSGILERADHYGVPTVSASLGGVTDLRGIMAISRLCRQRSIEIVNTHSSGDTWCAGIGGRLAGRKVVRTRHLSITVRPRLASRILYGRIPHMVVTTGQALADTLTSGGVVPAGRAVSIPTGVDLSQYRITSEMRAASRSEFGFSADDVVAGQIAMFRRMKGYAVLIPAFASALKDCPSLRLLIVGDNPPGGVDARPDIERDVRDRGVTDQTVFAGYRTDITHCLAAMDFLVLASTRDEGVPQSISQGMAAGLPVVATDVGSVREQVVPDLTGHLVEPGDPKALARAMIRMAQHPDQRERMGQQARERARACFSLEVMLDSTEELYDSILRTAG